ncbi:MAG TPA: DUF1254 domain-containing protein [Microbacterium sp.]|nr:DUF1254 domain-containing protein [Microbacterium sp.]
MTDATSAADLEELAAQAYLYAFPLVFNLEQVERFVTTGVGALASAPFNALSHARALATPQDDFVSVNNDTVYSLAQLDLSGGPARLHLPDSGDRYYVMQFVDAWTNNFAYVGKRATGTAAADFLIVPPGWQGEPDAAATVIHAPTAIVTIVGRWACEGVDDLPAVRALQDALTLTPQGAGNGIPPARAATPALDFWERYRVWSQSFPPADRDAALQASFARLGLTGDTPLDDLDDATKAALEAGFTKGGEALDAILTGGTSPVVNGWQLTLHLFDYNLDFFEVGALEDPHWQITDPRTRLADRAAAAKAGLWGNHGYEAAYFMTYIDERGEQLSGDRRYQLRLSPTPPVEAFWSVTMYALPDFYLVPNEIERYSIGDRTPGIIPDDDGGITLTMSANVPADPKARANWLPAPAGAFRPILRMYIPGEPVLVGSYAPPAITRLD